MKSNIDRQLLRMVRQLVHDECANYDHGDCLPYDKPCFAIFPGRSIHDGGIDCDWFLLSVLPLKPDLNKAIWQEIFREEDEPEFAPKKCGLCGGSFLPTANRQKYCPDCRKKAQRLRNRERKRRQRHGG